ncbi:thiamine phosphate synthase [Arcticibacter sp. MXS-1]|uniref:thiamine phosphate synthase n=1 Tax=Arcticibacter sp. MXS-1 TaxID=3341726 RepID=UPI0035A928CF
MLKDKQFPYRLYLVTDEAALRGRDLLWMVEEAVKGGVDLVQLREKKLEDEAFLLRALQLKEMLQRYNVPLIINDNLVVAERCAAAGIHVGKSDIPPSLVRKRWPGCGILGYSIEYEAQLDSEEALTSDYIALSPVFSTPTKTDTVTEWKLGGIRRVRATTAKPLVAIGAISRYNAASVVEAGADCLAVVSAICSAEDPQKAAAEIRSEIEKHL